MAVAVAVAVARGTQESGRIKKDQGRKYASGQRERASQCFHLFHLLASLQIALSWSWQVRFIYLYLIQRSIPSHSSYHHTQVITHKCLRASDGCDPVDMEVGDHDNINVGRRRRRRRRETLNPSWSNNDNPSVPWIKIGHHSLITNIDSLLRYSFVFIILHHYSLHFISCTTQSCYPDPPWQSLRRTTAHLGLYYPSPR